MPHPMPEDDLYDEYDQNPNENSGDEKESEDYGETFLAPKSALSGKGELSVGQIHRVRIERILDSEIELRCLKSDTKEKSISESDGETSGLYD